MSKYDSLARFLSEQSAETLTMGFDEVAKQVSGGLPQSAYDYRPWWANRHDGNDAQNKGWQDVGWETEGVDMKGQKVTFTRAVKTRSDFKDLPYVRPLTLQEAKEGLALTFGVPVAAIEITIKG
jgi:hypothetical protein